MSHSTPSFDLMNKDDNMNISSFPFELLPNEMRVPILKNLHDPLDKLNMMEALPSTEWLMGWNYIYLQFESIYPLVYPYLKWPYEDEKYEWKNVLNLCKASPEFQEIVINHFKKYITLTHNYSSGNQLFQEYHQAQIWGTEPCLTIYKFIADNDKEDKISQTWHFTTLPFGISTNLYTRTQAQFLTKLGTKLWSLQISLIDAYHKPGTINHLAKCLQLVPNLRRLNLLDYFHSEHSIYSDLRPNIVLHEERIVLPELPYLKMISLSGDCLNCQKYILPHYTRQLEVLDFHDCYLTENFNPTCFPKLEKIHIKFTQRVEYHNASIDKVHDLLKKFLLSPLKTISVILDQVNMTKFLNFMLTLKNFGNTLYSLEMKFGRMNSKIDDGVKNGMTEWVSQLSFPKLKCLHLDSYVGPLEFLLKMPALRKLGIINSSQKPLQLNTVFKGLQFSVEETDILECSIWEIFPLLEWLQMGSGEWEWVYHKKRISNGLPLKYWESY